MTSPLTRAVRSLLLLGAVLGLLAGPGAGAGAADEAGRPSYELIKGSGSSWAGNALAQWVPAVDSKGIKVVYTANGAAQGRKDYANKASDFAVTDSPYRGTDPSTGAVDSPLGRSFAYLPVVSGGTSFPYNLVVAGQQVRNLRLSGETIAKIFTNNISNWNDPAITADNNGVALPSIPIIPVVRADGAGITNQFTTWLVSQYPDLWKDCNGGKLAPTDYFPVNCGETRGQMRGLSGSDGVMNFVKGSGAVGAIAMEEYSYPLLSNFPVAKMLNKAGYFTLPTQYNVAVSLTKAEINNDPNDPNYLTQKLDNVYTNPDKRTYPLSSYVYAIIPTAADDSKMTTKKRQSLVDFLKYSICEGQSTVGKIGYSPLPVNLVQAGFTQVNKLKLADSGVQFDASIIKDVKNCFNPTFVPGKPKENHLAQIAPMPAECDKVGSTPCADGVGSYNEDPDENGEVPPDANNGGTGGNNGGTGTNTGGTGTSTGGTGTNNGGTGTNTGGTGTNTGGTGTGGTGAPAVDTNGDGIPDAPAAGGVVTGGVNADGTPAISPVQATTLDPDSAAGSSTMLLVLVAILFLAALLVPTLVGRNVRRSSRSGGRG